MKKRELFGVRYALGNIDDAVTETKQRIAELSGKYICFSNVHTLVMAVDHEGYRKILNRAEYTFPDGAPIAQKLKKMGEKTAERVAGPDFMEAMFKATSDGRLSHFFFGSNDLTLERLVKNIKSRYPNINIAGKYSPPFRKLTDAEDSEITELINGSGADIVWIGLGAPKQEIFMRSHLNQIKGLMMGVGAGFDYLAGTAKRAPLWMQRASLEWLYRLISEPERLAKRYLVTNAKFIGYCLTKR